MFDETIRLRNCKSKVERREIRRFILEAYQLYAEKNPNNVSQNICNGLAVGKEAAGMERIDRLYALLERDDIDEDTKAALRWAIFQLEDAT